MKSNYNSKYIDFKNYKPEKNSKENNDLFRAMTDIRNNPYFSELPTFQNNAGVVEFTIDKDTNPVYLGASSGGVLKNDLMNYGLPRSALHTEKKLGMKIAKHIPEKYHKGLNIDISPYKSPFDNEKNLLEAAKALQRDTGNFKNFFDANGSQVRLIQDRPPCTAGDNNCNEFLGKFAPKDSKFMHIVDRDNNIFSDPLKKQIDQYLNKYDDNNTIYDAARVKRDYAKLYDSFFNPPQLQQPSQLQQPQNNTNNFSNKFNNNNIPFQTGSLAALKFQRDQLAENPNWTDYTKKNLNLLNTAIAQIEERSQGEEVRQFENLSIPSNSNSINPKDIENEGYILRPGDVGYNSKSNSPNNSKSNSPNNSKSNSPKSSYSIFNNPNFVPNDPKYGTKTGAVDTFIGPNTPKYGPNNSMNHSSIFGQGSLLQQNNSMNQSPIFGQGSLPQQNNPKVIKGNDPGPDTKYFPLFKPKSPNNASRNMYGRFGGNNG